MFEENSLRLVYKGASCLQSGGWHAWARLFRLGLPWYKSGTCTYSVPTGCVWNTQGNVTLQLRALVLSHVHVFSSNVWLM